MQTQDLYLAGRPVDRLFVAAAAAASVFADERAPGLRFAAPTGPDFSFFAWLVWWW
jgi:hypothetical protein